MTPPLMHKTHHHFLRAAGEVAAASVREEMFGRPPRSLPCSFSHQAAGPVGSRRGRCHPAVRVTAGAFDAALGSAPPLFYMSVASGVQVLPVHGCGGGMRFRRCGSGWRLLLVGALGSAGSRSLAGSGRNGRAKGVWARVAGWRLPGGQPIGPAIDPPLRRHPFLYTYVFTPLRCDPLGRDLVVTECRTILRAFHIGPALVRNSRPGVAGVLPLPRLRARGALAPRAKDAAAGNRPFLTA